MAEMNCDISQQRSKSLEGFREERFDFIVSLCERASDNCPSWLSGGDFMRWSFDDPAAFQGTPAERRRLYSTTGAQIRRRIEMLLAVHKIS